MPVDHSFERTDRRLVRGETPLITEAYERAQYWLTHRSVNPEKFPDAFNPVTVKQDMGKARALEEKFARAETPAQREEHKIATIFEVALWWLTQQKRFLGEKTKAILPSRYDDYINGTDLILEIEGADELVARLGLGIDATFGTTAVEEKLQVLTDDVEAGKTNDIKYYVSGDRRQKGMLSGEPRAIVGLSVERAREMAGLWRRSERGETVSVAPDKHPLRALILSQLSGQARALSLLAKKHGHIELAKRYDAVFKRLDPITTEATRLLRNKQDWLDAEDKDYRQDPVHLAIMAKIEAWRKAAEVA